MKMEPVDIYNKDKQKTGKIKMRYRDTLESDEYTLAVKAIIINSNSQVLISKRAKTKQKDAGLWEINGGVCLAGENSLQGIIREIKEELGIDLNNVKGILYKEYSERQLFYDIWLFKLDIDIKNLIFADNEVEDAKWVNIEECKVMEEEGKIIYYQQLDYKDYEKCIQFVNGINKKGDKNGI